jgi:hypothetical protein
VYTWIWTHIQSLLRELSGPRPFCRDTDIVFKPHIWDLYIYIIYPYV